MTHASLFSGIGGFDYSAALLGWINIFDCEIDAFWYGCVSRSYIKCIPYNEQTKHLLGTKNDI